MAISIIKSKAFFFIFFGFLWCYDVMFLCSLPDQLVIVGGDDAGPLLHEVIAQQFNETFQLPSVHAGGGLVQQEHGHPPAEGRGQDHTLFFPFA
jgi:hypothetical protein